MAQRKGCLIGCGVAAVIGLVLLGVVGFGAVKLFGYVQDSMIDPKVYEAVKEGDAESAVRGKLPAPDDNLLTSALKDGGPAEPAGSVCVWYLSDRDDSDQVFRFCFKDGKLAQKAQYAMK
ncbi:hypothetical protein [Streptomyces sp. NPDC089919]|uniref:hypothetical protein n=1 Tax=Streptomyces sp. NPDC089919 TaxID=3155188 RepID=UPI00342D81CD